MILRRLDATFGVLERRSLSFAPGLNIVEAPNESGKSTLAAFLRAMLYGLPTRDRGALAEKNRYQPWSGAPMQGTLELSSEAFGEITIRRDTPRANSPMGRFSATYTGTGDEVPGLSAADCGEELLGVPREVFERSAFIRQSGLAVDADAELERRIAALITTGEEGVSYSEADAALRKQLNARRANSRSGVIPALEQEIADGESALNELRALAAEHSEAEETLSALRKTEAELCDGIEAHAIADRQEQYIAREQAKRDADDAAREARVFRRMLEDSRVPPREVLEENRGRLRTVEDLERRQRDAKQKRDDAELALNQFDATPKPAALRPIAILLFLLLLLCAVFAPAAILIPLPVPAAALYASAAAIVPLAALCAFERQRTKKRCTEHTRQRETLETALRETDAVCAALKTTAEQTLARLYEEIPAGDAASAAAYVHENLARYDMLVQMEADAQGKKRRYEDIPRPDIKDVPAYPAKRPQRSRAELEDELARVKERRSEAQSRADYTAGRLRALGDAGEMEEALAEKRERLAAAQEEYEAVALAREALEAANTALQNRFSPELGRRAGEYFSALSRGRYDTVALDRTFHALATASGDSVAHDAALLSQGASDQLYLAVRLAICDMVLPTETSVPLVLDDALINFDDARCAAALDLLAREGKTRQILLLTCQHREAVYLADRCAVNIISL